MAWHRHRRINGSGFDVALLILVHRNQPHWHDISVKAASLSIGNTLHLYLSWSNIRNNTARAYVLHFDPVL